MGEPSTDARRDGGASPREPPWTVRLAAFSAAHRWPVIGLWFVATIGIFLASIAAGGTASENAVSDDGGPEYESEPGLRRLQRLGDPGHRPAPVPRRLARDAGTVDDPAVAAVVDDIVTRVRGPDHDDRRRVDPDLRGRRRSAPRAARGRARLAGPDGGPHRRRASRATDRAARERLAPVPGVPRRAPWAPTPAGASTASTAPSPTTTSRRWSTRTSMRRCASRSR